MSLAVVFPSALWFVVGAVVVVLGAITGKVLAMAGYGAKKSTYQAVHRRRAAGPRRRSTAAPSSRRFRVETPARHADRRLARRSPKGPLSHYRRRVASKGALNQP